MKSKRYEQENNYNAEENNYYSARHYAITS